MQHFGRGAFFRLCLIEICEVPILAALTDTVRVMLAWIVQRSKIAATQEQMRRKLAWNADKTIAAVIVASLVFGTGGAVGATKTCVVSNIRMPLRVEKVRTYRKCVSMS
jgi:hypothetical protein